MAGFLTFNFYLFILNLILTLNLIETVGKLLNNKKTGTVGKKDGGQ